MDESAREVLAELMRKFYVIHSQYPDQALIFACSFSAQALAVMSVEHRFRYFEFLRDIFAKIVAEKFEDGQDFLSFLKDTIAIQKENEGNDGN